MAIVVNGCSGGQANVHSEHQTTSTGHFRRPSDIEGIEFIVDCNRSVPTSGYFAETNSYVPLDSEYATSCEIGEGLVTMMDTGTRVVQFHVDRELITSAFEIRYDMDVYDKIDILQTTMGELIVVHTYTTNAGIFTASHVWPLASTSNLSDLPPSIRQHVENTFAQCSAS